MKKAIIFSILTLICSSTFAQSNFGAKVKSTRKAIPANMVAAKLEGKEQTKISVTGIVEDVCQAKGCWMKVTTESGKSMRVTFKDYGFFVPKDIAGKKVTFEGVAFKKETSVADLKHYAMDAGKSEAEIAKIIVPENDITFIANGVIVEK
jgi:Domain of unknown function (DUF4920)